MQLYGIYRCCERFGQGIRWFYEQDKQMQIDLLAYCQIRNLEEAHEMTTYLKAGAYRG